MIDTYDVSSESHVMDPHPPFNDDPLLRSVDEVFAAPPEQRPGLAKSLFGHNPELLARVLEAISGDRLGMLAAEVRGLYRTPRAAEDIADGHEPDRLTVGRYRLLEKIGEGGFGEVYVAEQREPMRRLVAVKIVKAGMDSRVVIARFEAERQALALMDHPNIARVFDGGATDAGRPYFVMELVRGIPITEYCDRHQLGVRERLDLAIQVCHAVQHAHQKGIIHRDLKPANVLVTLVDAKPVPKVIDFGIAKAVETPLTDKTIYTEFRQFIGSPAYMSPERIGMSGQDVDTRSDIYSLGVLDLRAGHRFDPL
jgi:serine/threonine protein kinase